MIARAAGMLRGSRPLRFLIVGGFNTLTCYAVYAVLVRLGIPFALANLMALLFGICLSFTLQRRFVFESRDPGRCWRCVASWGAIYAVQTACIALLVRRGMDPVLAGLIVLPATTVASYLIQKLLVFRAPAGVGR